MLYLINNTNQNIRLNIFVNHVLWDEHIMPAGHPGDTIIIPSSAHKEAIKPYLKPLHLTLMENGIIFDIHAPVSITKPNTALDEATPTRLISEINNINDDSTLKEMIDQMYHKTYDPATAKKLEEKKAPATSAYAEELRIKTKAELKNMCADLDLDPKGSKEDLITRMVEKEKRKELLAKL